MLKYNINRIVTALLYGRIYVLLVVKVFSSFTCFYSSAS